MHLSADVVVHRTPEAVTAFLGDVRNVPRWDRGVGSVHVPDAGASGVGFAFETLGHPGSAADDGRMAYEVSAAGPEGSTVRLTSTDGNARYFKNAAWHFRLDPVPDGTRITCVAEFTLHFRYLFLAPVLFFTRRAIRTDLEHLRDVLEAA